jgi:hypothetical protein
LRAEVRQAVQRARLSGYALAEEQTISGFG